MKKVDFGARGKNFALDMLAVGGSFARLVLSRLEAATGDAWSFLPDHFDLTLASSLTARIDWAGEQSPIVESLVGGFRQRLLETDGWLLVEDRYLTEHGMDKTLPPHFFAGPSAYYYSLGASNLETIEQTLRHGSRRPFLGFLGLHFPARSFEPGGEAPPDLLSELAASTEVVIVGLFDNESYLLWEPLADPPEVG